MHDKEAALVLEVQSIMMPPSVKGTHIVAMANPLRHYGGFVLG